MEARAEITVSGRVQKAGFRDLVEEKAVGFGLKGFVRNIPDGTVLIVCEGAKSLIEDFIKSIDVKTYPIIVSDIKIYYSEPKSQFKDFDIIRQEDTTTATFERMDTAARYLREMHKDLSGGLREMHKDLGGSIKEMHKDLSGKMEKMDVDINKMNSDINSNFSTMAMKYDKIGGSLEEIAKQVKKI